jgi:hypothetical protein
VRPDFIEQPAGMKSRAVPMHIHHEVNVLHGFDMRSKLQALAALHSRQKAQ